MRKKQEEKKMTLEQWLIRKLDTGSFRAGKASGWIHPEAKQEMLDAVGGKRNLIEQAKRMEKDRSFDGLFYVTWFDMGGDIKKMDVSVDIMDALCRREGIENPRERQLRYLGQMQKWKADAKADWIYPFYDDLLRRLENGEKVKDPDPEDKDYFSCLNAVVNNSENIWKRIFSVAVFGDSKCFKNNYQTRMFKLMKKYSPLYEEGMTEDELLAAHGILSYAQTLEWKGALMYRIDEGAVIDTSDMPYGTVLNARTLDHAVPVSLSGIKRIMTIENKANYESMAYETDTLYIFCHGFFSPKERRFLERLAAIAEEGVEYLHWGDMDYGGIRIFLFNRKNLFPKLCPYRMGREDYEAAVRMHAGMKLEPEKREKLEHMDAGALEELKNCILEKNLEIEQEVLLAAEYGSSIRQLFR